MISDSRRISFLMISRAVRPFGNFCTCFSSSAISARTNCTIAGMSMAAPRTITPDTPRGGQATGGLLQDHHLGRLHDRADFVSDGEPEVLRGGARDHGDDLLPADVEHDLGHEVAEPDADDLPLELAAWRGCRRRAR